METKMYSVKQVAELLNVTPPTIRSWAASGQIKAIKIGSTLRFKKDWIDAIMEG